RPKMVLTSRRTLAISEFISGGRMLGGMELRFVGYGLYGGFGEGRVWAEAVWGTLKSPSTAARPAVTNLDVCRRIGVPSSTQASNCRLMTSQSAGLWRAPEI